MPREESIPEAARRKLSSPWATGLGILITILWTIPTFGLLVTSLRPSAEAQTTGWWTIFTNPTLTLDNYSQVISGGSVIPNGIAPYFFNSFAIAIPAAIFPLVIACMAAYAIAWIPFKGSTFIFFTNVATEFHFSYERFLVNRLRESFGLMGTPIRIHVRRRER
jgi:alpha-glucoside transport system permease protein